jgi:hypothetical protein
VLDRLDLDTEKPSEEEIAKRFGYEDEYADGRELGTYLHLFYILPN